MIRLWPAYVMWHGPFLTRLVFANEKAWDCVYIAPVQGNYSETLPAQDCVITTITSIALLLYPSLGLALLKYEQW